jgi:SAM-dependent MidA family methyltransferase
VHPLSRPGESDLTVNVPFAMLSKALPASAQKHDSITQHDFLESMGIHAILEKAKQNGDGSELQSGVDRVTGTQPGQMGALYRFWAALDSNAAANDWFPFIRP